MPDAKNGAAVQGESFQCFDDDGGKGRRLTVVAVVIVLQLRQIAEIRRFFPESFAERCPGDVPRFDLIDLIRGSSVITEDEDGIRVCGVMTESKAVYSASAVVICSGTYMESRTIRGEIVALSGPDGLPRSVGLSSSLASKGITILRFKTGTPVRVNSGRIDFDVMTRQDGETDVPPFSFDNEMNGVTVPQDQVPCWSVWTTDETREIISSNMDRSPLYSGVITGIGPRYCPSIEDKFMRFKDKNRHQIFVEPMGRETSEMYLQGFSTSLPEEVQVQMVRSLPGLDKAMIQRSAYAIEYDLVDPLSLRPTLESKIVDGLFTAGQINGSSGYEEAAAQGIVAGINAGLKLKNEEPMILDRSQAYIGVLIDDLVTKGTSEPYRMMTSRAEYRLFLPFNKLGKITVLCDQLLIASFLNDLAVVLSLRAQAPIFRLREYLSRSS